MITLTEALNDLKAYLWKPAHLELAGRTLGVFLFDIREAGEEDLEDLISDTFCDGMPPGLNLQKKVPFGIVGLLKEKFAPGSFGAIDQAEHMLFVDVENGEPGSIPVWAVVIDGTAIVSSFKKIADDVSELIFKPGLGATS